jgi:hypothetical protein
MALMIGVFILNYFDLFNYKFFAPKHENARREVFQNTRSYNEAKVQDLTKYMLEYKLASVEDKEVLKNTILLMFSDYPKERLPVELKQFIDGLYINY